MQFAFPNIQPKSEHVVIVEVAEMSVDLPVGFWRLSNDESDALGLDQAYSA